MITVRRENRIVRVTENELEKYLNTGYEVVGGMPVEKPAPTAQPEILAPIEEPKPMKVTQTKETVAEQPKSRKRRK